MLNFTGGLKVFLASGATDLRKSFSGLYGYAMDVLKEDPQKGALFVFTNRSRTRLKILLWDGTGMWVMTKRLAQGTFWWPRTTEGTPAKLELTGEALVLLLNGVDLKVGSLRPWYQR